MSADAIAFPEPGVLFAPELQQIKQRLTLEIHKLGFLAGEVTLPDAADTALEAVQDPYTGAANWRAVLRDGAGQKLGQIQFNSDDSFFAEFDVVRPHPKDPRWFVEGVLAWGRGDVVKSEAKLLPALQ